MNSEKNEKDYLDAEELFADAEDAIESGDSAAAEKLLRQVVTKNPCFSYAYRLLAQIVAQNGRLPEAIRILDACIKNDAGYSYAYYLSAKYRSRAGDADTAGRFLAKARTIEPDSRLYALSGRLLKNSVSPGQ